MLHFTAIAIQSGAINEGIDAISLPPHIREAVDRHRKIYMTYSPPEARYLALHRGHLMFLRPEEEPLVTAELIRDTTYSATADVLVERIRELKAAGYTQFAVQIVPGHEDAIDEWAGVFDQV